MSTQTHTARNGPGYAISNAMVQLLRAHAGRGPTKAKTVISESLVLVTLGDCLTTLEKSLAASGETELVARVRELLHEALRDEAVEIVESATGRRVSAYLTDQTQDPDVALIAFVLDGDTPPDTGGDAQVE